MRVAEFDRLFSDILLDVERTALTVLRLTLEPATEQHARELAARDSECCALFTFTFNRGANGRTVMAVMEVATPKTRRSVLDAQAERAGAGRHARGRGR